MAIVLCLLLASLCVINKVCHFTHFTGLQLMNVLDSGKKLRDSRRLMLNGVEEVLCN